MKKTFLTGKISVQKSDEGRITVIASDETLDRHGEVVGINNWDLSKFIASPRMLVDHNHQVSSIVGKWANIRIEGGKLLMDAVFHGITELSKAVEKMVNEGFLDTVSVGFIMHGPKKDGGQDTNELIETSWVTVPANPNARVTEMMKSIETKELDAEGEQKLKDFLGETKSEEQEKELPVITDTEIFKKVTAEFPDEKVLLCEAQFISKLLADIETLQTLNADLKKSNKVEVSKETTRIMRAALKEVAKTASDSLRKAKHGAKITK